MIVPKYILSPNAVLSLKKISTYTLKTHGEQQQRRYINELQERFRYLAGHPKYGKPRDDLKADYLSHPQGLHMIYYRVISDRVEIIDVLHQSMDAQLHL